MNYLIKIKREKPFYFTYEAIQEHMKKYLPDIEYFGSFINDTLYEDHCDLTNCHSCVFCGDSGGHTCSFLAKRVNYNDSSFTCRIDREDAKHLVEGLNAAKDICNSHTSSDCEQCWLRQGPDRIYLCGGRIA